MDISKSRLIIDSENLFYKETILQDDNPPAPVLDADMTLIPRFDEEDGRSSENKESYLPKESDSDLSSNDMIVFVDPEEYEKKLASKRNVGVPEPKAAWQVSQPLRTQSKAGRRPKRIDGMRTGASFYPKKGYNRN